jgi:hypothetical protein
VNIIEGIACYMSRIEGKFIFVLDRSELVMCSDF